MRSVFLVHSLRKGGAERLVLELASSIKSSSITVISWLDNLEFLEDEYKNVKVIPLIKENEYRWLFSLISSSKKLRMESIERRYWCISLLSNRVPKRKLFLYEFINNKY